MVLYDPFHLMARLKPLRFSRASARAIAIFLKAALRWTVVRRVTKQQAKQAKSDQKLSLLFEKNMDDEFCLICWETLFPTPQPEEDNSPNRKSETITSSCTASPRLDAISSSPVHYSDKPPITQTTSPISSRRSSAPIIIDNDISLIIPQSPQSTKSPLSPQSPLSPLSPPPS